MLRAAAFAALLSLGGAASSAADAGCVVLLHGLARTANSMLLLESRLSGAGFHTVNETYPSTEFDLATLIEATPPPRIEACGARRPIHFVTHSMGGIIMRGFLARRSVEGLGRLVLLGPPNKGSELVDLLKDLPGFAYLNGPAGAELGAAVDALPGRIKDGDAAFGVIAGDLSLNPLFSRLIPGPDDGKVAVESTKFAAMTDHIVLPVSHTFMMLDAEVARQAIHFLRRGAFDR